jgi:predicted membrane-bound mannosyltransferase
MNKKAFAGLFLLIVLGAAAFRLAGLCLRPMHHDEANQALKFGALLESGDYRYDKADHHGPSLYYLSLPFARALGANTLAALSEKTLRLVPACFAIGAILLLLLFVPLIGKEAVLWSALGLASTSRRRFSCSFWSVSSPPSGAISGGRRGPGQWRRASLPG